MCKYFVIASLLISIPALASDAIELRSNDRIAATLINDTRVVANDTVNVLFDPHTLNAGGEETALPEHCLLATDATMNGSLLLLAPRTMLCITAQQKVVEGALQGFATSGGVAAIPFDCVRRNANGCAEARIASGMSVEFTITESTVLRPQR